MALAHPGVVPNELAPDEETEPFHVQALIMHVVRSMDNQGNPVVSTYHRGDTVLLTPSYAAPYIQQRLLARSPQDPTAEEDSAVEEEPPRPSGRAARNKAADESDPEE